METQITVKKGDLFTFLKYAKGYVGQFQAERTQLTFALQKLIKRYQVWLKEFEDKLSEIRDDAEVEFCLKDKTTGAFLEKEYTFQGQPIMRKLFDKAGSDSKKAKIDQQFKDLQAETITIEPHFVPVPDKIDISWLPVFTGYVFREMTEAEEQTWYLAQELSIEKKE